MSKKILYLIRKNPSLLPFLVLDVVSRFLTAKLFGCFGFSLFPEMITILVTKRCNFRCPGCSTASPIYTKNLNKDTFRELTTDDIKKIIGEVSFFKPFIYFNGGEPTLRPDLVELIRYVKEKRMICALTTNGSLLNRKFLKQLIEAKLDFLSVSIDGPEEFHDQMRGFKGAFKKATDGIREMVKLRKELGVEYPHIRLASIIYPEKVSNSNYIVSLANKLRVDELGFGLLMFYPRRIIKEQAGLVEKCKTGGPDPIGYQIGDSDKINFLPKDYQEFLSYIRKEAKIPVYFAYQGKEFAKYFDPEIFPSEKSKCLTPWKVALIAPNGDLEICQGFKFGSIFDGSILKQWNNKKIRDFRKLRAKMPFPACFRCNEGQKLVFD